jgi:hypothetical protein
MQIMPGEASTKGARKVKWRAELFWLFAVNNSGIVVGHILWHREAYTKKDRQSEINVVGSSISWHR